MSKTSLICFLLLGITSCFCCSPAQQEQYSISIDCKSFPYSHILITQNKGDRHVIIDTLRHKKDLTYSTSFNAEQEKGMYFIVFPDNPSLEIPFIYNAENIRFQIDFSRLEHGIEVLESDENEQYYAFLRFNDSVAYRISQIEKIYNSHLHDIDYIEELKHSYTSLLQKEKLFIENSIRNNPHSMATRFISSSRMNTPPYLMTTSARNEYLKSHFFTHINFSDTLLFDSKILSSACIQYLLLHAQYRTPEDPYSALKQAVDTIITYSAPHPKTFDYVIRYLLDGFEKMQNQRLLQYISERYIEHVQCENSDYHETLERRALQQIVFAQGNSVPEFFAISTTGDTISNSSCVHKTTILFFWASWCSHCTVLIPNIIHLYSKQANPNYSLVFISLDDDRKAFETTIAGIPHFSEFTHIFDGKEWDGALAQAFYIYASPSIFVITNNAIHSTPTDLTGYIRSLQNLGLQP